MGDFDFYDLCINKAMADRCKIEIRKEAEQEGRDVGKVRFSQ
jgi:hypothetical protein